MLRRLERMVRHAIRGYRRHEEDRIPAELGLFKDGLSRRIFLGVLEARRSGGFPHHFRQSLASCHQPCAMALCAAECIGSV